MRVIVVTWLYAPTPTPRAIRWQTLSEEFARAGHRVEVITSEVPGATSSSGLEGLTIHRVGGILGANIGPAIRSTAAEESRETRRVSARIRKFASDMACRIYDASWKKVYWPDRACSWFPAALRRAERIVKDGDCDAIITVSLPFTAHLVGYSIKRRHLALPWIVDIGDPFACQDQGGTEQLRSASTPQRALGKKGSRVVRLCFCHQSDYVGPVRVDVSRCEEQAACDSALCSGGCPALRHFHFPDEWGRSHRLRRTPLPGYSKPAVPAGPTPRAFRYSGGSLRTPLHRRCVGLRG